MINETNIKSVAQLAINLRYCYSPRKATQNVGEHMWPMSCNLSTIAIEQRLPKYGSRRVKKWVVPRWF